MFPGQHAQGFNFVSDLVRVIHRVDHGFYRKSFSVSFIFARLIERIRKRLFRVNRQTVIVENSFFVLSSNAAFVNGNIAFDKLWNLVFLLSPALTALQPFGEHTLVYTFNVSLVPTFILNDFKYSPVSVRRKQSR